MKRGKKDRNEEKLKKKMQKDVEFAVCFHNRAFSWWFGLIAQVVAGGGWVKC